MPCAANGEKLQERTSRIDQQTDALARKQFSARNVPRARFLAAALHRRLELAAQVRDQDLHRSGIAGEFCRARVDA